MKSELSRGAFLKQERPQRYKIQAKIHAADKEQYKKTVSTKTWDSFQLLLQIRAWHGSE